MFQMTGYLAGVNEDIVSPEQELLVTGCGRYRLLHREEFHTCRPEGRADYQLLYVAGGAGFFSVKGEPLRVREGTGILYRPGEPQDYRYLLSDSPDICWIHFTGGRAEGLLAEAGLEGSLLPVGQKAVYTSLFEGIIRELQLKRPGFSAIASARGMELLFQLGRGLSGAGEGPEERVEELLAYFHQNFQKEITVEECAREFHISESWLIRCFRQRTGMAPGRYLTEIRLSQAKELLSSSSLNVGEVAALVGYENPLYFSRLFRKYQGVSPKEYREGRRKDKS